MDPKRSADLAPHYEAIDDIDPSLGPHIRAVLDKIAECSEGLYEPVTKADLFEAMATAAPAPATAGRHRSEDRIRADGAASFRVEMYGEPESQAELVRDLVEWCDATGIELSERTLREVAAEAIRRHRARPV
jgi:hypothetical protein